MLLNLEEVIEELTIYLRALFARREYKRERKHPEWVDVGGEG